MEPLSPKKDELDAYLNMLEEAKKRDHRRLGKELGLFMLTEEGPGFPFFLPNGMVLKNTLIDYWREVHKRYGYVEVSTPIILSRKLWERSGHWDHYKNNMYTTVIDDEDFAIKPMNCPGGMLVYKSQPHSYRELPLRVGELGIVHRHELSGALHGLFRVRCFTQDDAHIFMTPDQMKDEIKNVVKLFDEVYSVFGLSYKIELSTMPEDHIGTVEQWEHNQDILKEAITEMGKDFTINEGDGAFYGPKLDFHLADSLGRTWQCGTIQLDSQLPERFELEYIGADGEKHRPIMIHRVVLGFDRALYRRHHRALRRRVPDLACTGAGAHYADDRPQRTLLAGGCRSADQSGLPRDDGRSQRKDRLQDPRGPGAQGAVYGHHRRQGRREGHHLGARAQDRRNHADGACRVY